MSNPTPDVDKYIELAREKNVSITHVFETHIHADLVSGARELCARVDSAKHFISHEAGANYGFQTEQLHDGDTFTFGETVVTVRHTPGHTPEHIKFELAETETPDKPWPWRMEEGPHPRRATFLPAGAAREKRCAR